MQAEGKRRSLLRDLALIYITLAHSTDQDLSEIEVETISKRLNAWQTHVTEETVLSAIKDALEDYTQEAGPDEVRAAVRRVGDEVEEDLRKTIVDDLTDIALSDDKFLHEESVFISDLARMWGVHVDLEGERAVPWSVLIDNGTSANGWSPLHDLALVYLHLAHRTDADLDTKEVEAIARTLNEWTPDIAEDRVLNVVQGAMHAYVQGPDKRLFEDSIDALKHSVPTHQREALLHDLQQIAEADGKVVPEERDVIRRLARAWEVAV